MDSAWESLQTILLQIDTAVQTRDMKSCANALRYLPSLRRVLGPPGAAALYNKLYGSDPTWAPSTDIPLFPLSSVESMSFIKLVIVSVLVGQGALTEALEMITKELEESQGNKAESILAKFFFYLALIQERQGDCEVKLFFKWYRVVSLRHDNFSQATLINIILRFFLTNNRIQQAREFADKTGFPDNAPYPEVARNQYYLGRVHALQLDYTEAHDRLIQASRKAPEHLAGGFKLTVDKLRVLVELLMGEIPIRKTLVGLAGLQSYAALVRAVRSGELEQYSGVIQVHKEQFIHDGNLSMVERLRHIVIKSGLKRINIAYSNISLEDIAGKLGLPAEDTEFIVAKAVRDGVISAVIDHEAGVLMSRVLEDKYKTLEPQQLFSKRIVFCLDLRNDAIRAMRFPSKEKKKEEIDPPEEVELHVTEEDDEF